MSEFMGRGLSEDVGELPMWVVSTCTDQIRQKPVKEATRYWCGREMYPYKFLTENEAKQFIIDRAKAELERAESAAKKAATRLRKVSRKFAPTPEVRGE